MGSLRLEIARADLEAACRRHHIRRLSAFGSVLREDFTPHSDVDLLVEFEPGHAVGFEIFDVEEDLSLVFGGRRVDRGQPEVPELAPQGPHPVLGRAALCSMTTTSMSGTCSTWR